MKMSNALRRTIAKTCPMVLFFVLLAPLALRAHGTYSFVVTETGFLISAFYDDGEPMSYTEVAIHKDTDTIAYQTGRTDKYGRFMFFPQEKGRYKAVVRDEMGHGVTLRVETDDRMIQAGEGFQTAPAGAKAPGLFAGLGFIFFLSGLGFWAAGKGRGHT